MLRLLLLRLFAEERMDSSSTEASDPRMQVHGAHASSVIVHCLPPERVERFLELQRGITQAAEGFRGYEATDVYPPTESQDANWVVVIHFDDPETLQVWLDSPVRTSGSRSSATKWEISD